MKLLKKVLLSLFITAGVLLLIAHIAGMLADRIIFQPRADLYPDLEGVEILSLKNGEGRIAVRFTPPERSDSLVFLHCHGNAENLRSLAWRQEMFRARGYGFCAFDYEGYGRSSGKASEKSAERDVFRVWQYLITERNIPPERIVLHGFSLGTGVATFLASKVSGYRALILEAPFTSTYAVAGLAWVPGNRFPSFRYIAQVKSPILIMHGDRDRIIPFSHGKKLYEKAPSPKRFYRIQGAGHNDIIATAGNDYWRNLNEFLK